MKKIILIVLISTIIIFLIFKKDKYLDIYTINNDSVSSVYKITGLEDNGKIKKIDDSKYIINFKKNTNAIYYAVKYANYLWKNENFYIISNYNFSKEDGKIEIAKTSVDKDKVFKVSVNCDSTNSFNIVLSLIDGSLIINNRN